MVYHWFVHNANLALINGYMDIVALIIIIIIIIILATSKLNFMVKFWKIND